MQVRPENSGGHAVGGMNQMVMVGPVDAQDDEAEDIGDEDGHDWQHGIPVGSLWNAQLQHHDGDENGDDAVAERFETRLVQLRRDAGMPIVIANVRSCDWMMRMFFAPIRSNCFCAPFSDSRRSSEYW